jgi:superoxide dismutase, Fe-Mn family
MPYTLAALPYPYNALEPYIDTKTMELHHDKHQQAYIDGLNKALQTYPELQKVPLVELLSKLHDIPEGIRTAVRNSGGGELNHSMFWLMMKKDGGGDPKGKVADAIKKKFGNFGVFKEEFDTAAKSRFGSGWAWLVVNKKGDLEITSTANQDTPFSVGLTPILGLDVWEHAYYLKYENRRVDYIKAWWNVVNSATKKGLGNDRTS